MCLFVGSLAQVWRLQHVLTNVSVSPRGFCHCWLFTSPLIIVTLTTCGHQVTRNVWDGHYTLRRFKQQFSYSSLYYFSSQNVLFIFSCHRNPTRWIIYWSERVTCDLLHIPNSTESRCYKCMKSSRNPRLWLAPGPGHVISWANEGAACHNSEPVGVYTARYPSHTKLRICEVSIKILLE